MTLYRELRDAAAVLVFLSVSYLLEIFGHSVSRDIQEPRRRVAYNAREASLPAHGGEKNRSRIGQAKTGAMVRAG